MFIEELNLKNFKSFKKASLSFEKGFNLILGPNGSGKSNVVDAFRFVFGEASLKSMRVRNVSQLIFENGNMAEIELKLKSGEEVHVLKRLIRKDGKTKYKLDGKTVKRYDVTDFLSVNRLYMSNFIIQGAIERIVNMSVKERRGLIDDVSNIGEYENKKQEAMRELGIVQKNLDEANVSLNEKRGYLTELKRDKEEAEKFLRLKRERDELEASLVFLDVKTFESKLEGIILNSKKKREEIEKINGEMAALSERIAGKTNELNEINMKILAGSEGEKNVLEKRVLESESSANVMRSRLEELKSSLNGNYSSKKELEGNLLRYTDDLNGLKNQLKEKEKSLAELGRLLSENDDRLKEKEKNSDLFGKDYFDLKLFIQNTESEILGLNAGLSKLQGESAEIDGLKKAKNSEIESLKKPNVESVEGKLSKLNDDRKNLNLKLKSLNDSLNDLYANEKKMNERKASLESDFLKTREKIGVLSSSSTTISRTNEALKGFKGVFGVVGELCDYNGLTLPVEVALGGRFNFFVVDSVDVAVKAVNFLKSNNIGRGSFIPLDKIKFEPRDERVEKIVKTMGKECKGFLVDLVKFDKKFDNVFNFAFGDTILVDSVEACKPFIGKARMVTIGGELFETSGLVSGGSWKSSGVASKKELKDLEEKAVKTDSERKNILKELGELKTEIEKIRHDKSEMEVGIKVLDIEEKSLMEKRQSGESAAKERKEKLRSLNEELEKLEKELENKSSEKRELIKKISELNVRLVEARSKTDVEREKDLGFELKELEKKVIDLKNEWNKSNAEVTVLTAKIELSEKQVESSKKDVKKITDEESRNKKIFENTESEIKVLSKKLGEDREKLKALSSTKTEFEVKRESVGEEIKKLSIKRGQMQFRKDELTVEVNKLSTEEAVAMTNLANKKEQFSVFEGLNLTFDVDSSDKPRLIARLKEVSDDIPDESKINQKAIEEFGLKAVEVEELNGKVGVLDVDRKSILNLIEETEEKKISTFMSVFNFVNSNFKNLFSQIFDGEGTLVLDDNENPFNGGLSIKVSLKSKGVSFLDLMSGGEKSLIALIFLFAIQSYNPSSVYVLDEADAALDHENALRLSMLIKKLSVNSQFFVISHNQSVFREADCLIGVSMVGDESKLVEVNVTEA